jgi:hypothetical protein
MNAFIKLILGGWLLHSAADSLYQDALGKEQFMRLVDVTWIDPLITVPLAILTLLLAYWLIKLGHKELS